MNTQLVWIVAAIAIIAILALFIKSDAEACNRAKTFGRIVVDAIMISLFVLLIFWIGELTSKAFHLTNKLMSFMDGIPLV